MWLLGVAGQGNEIRQNETLLTGRVTCVRTEMVSVALL